MEEVIPSSPHSFSSMITVPDTVPDAVPGTESDTTQDNQNLPPLPTVSLRSPRPSSRPSNPLRSPSPSPSPKYGYRKRKRDPIPPHCMRPLEKEECLICYQKVERSNMLSCSQCDEMTCTTCIMQLMDVPRRGAVVVNCPFCRKKNGITNGVILDHFNSACSDPTKMTVFEPSIGIISIMGGKKLLVQRASNKGDSVEKLYTATTPLVQPHLQSPDFDALYWMDDKRALPGFECFIGVKTVKRGPPKLTIFQRSKYCVPPLSSRKQANEVAYV